MYTGLMEYMFTYDNEYIVAETGKIYKGYYNQDHTGTYSGMLREETSEKLLKDSEYNTYKTFSPDYDAIIPTEDFNPFKSIKIKSYYPQPTIKDYELGYFTRYFTKHKLNSVVSIIEIDQDEYNTINNETILPYILYKTVELYWTIDNIGSTLDIASTNYNTVKNLEYKFQGISKYFINFKEFAKI